MSTASFKFWFPRFFLYFLLLIHNDSLRFKNILLPQAPCQKLITTYGGQEQSIGCIPSFCFTQTSIPAKSQSFIRTCTPPYATKSTEKIPQLSDAFSELFTSHFIEKNANPEAKLQPKSQLYPFTMFISKESAPKRQVTSPSQRRPGSLATNNMASTQLSQMVSLC